MTVVKLKKKIICRKNENNTENKEKNLKNLEYKQIFIKKILPSV